MIHRRKRKNEGNKKIKKRIPVRNIGRGGAGTFGRHGGGGGGVQGKGAQEGCRRGEAGSYAASGHTHFSIFLFNAITFRPQIHRRVDQFL